MDCTAPMLKVSVCRGEKAAVSSEAWGCHYLLIKQHGHMSRMQERDVGSRGRYRQCDDSNQRYGLADGKRLHVFFNLPALADSFFVLETGKGVSL